MNNPKPNEKIIQIVKWDGHLLGLSSEGRIYRCIVSGDLKDSDKHVWGPFMDTLFDKYTGKI